MAFIKLMVYYLGAIEVKWYVFIYICIINIIYSIILLSRDKIDTFFFRTLTTLKKLVWVSICVTNAKSSLTVN